MYAPTCMCVYIYTCVYIYIEREGCVVIVVYVSE